MSHIRILGLILVAHIILLLLVAGEDADFTNICAEEAFQDSVPKGSCPATDEEDFEIDIII